MVKVCECGCGKDMSMRRSDARFASSRCRVRAHRAKADRIPERMRREDRWMRWTLAKRGDRMTKRPLTVAGRSGSSTNPATWSTYEAAKASIVGTGVGYALGAGIGCYDLDDALQDGHLKPWAADVLAGIPEPVIFMEVSQSGRGVHVFIEAPEGPGRVIRDGRKIERYTAGRFIAMTGQRFTP